MQKDELKAKFQSRSIKQIEGQIRADLKKSRESERQVAEALTYLEKTGRFKENPQYKTATFEKYLGYEFNMKYGQYHALSRAWVYWPETCAKYGAGVVAKTVRTVGVRNTESVVSDLARREQKRKTPLSIQDIETTIKAHKPKVKPKAPERSVNYRVEWGREREARIKAEESLRRAEDRIREQDRLIQALRKENADLKRQGVGHPVIPLHPSIAHRERVGA